MAHKRQGASTRTGHTEVPVTALIQTCELPDWMRNPNGTLASFLPFMDTSQGQLHFLVPSGIGDVCWLWAKFATLSKTRDITWYFPDDTHKRVAPYADLVGMKYKFLPIDIRELLSYPGEFTPDDLAEGGVFYLHVNRHLEEGRPLAEWHPWLPFTNPAPPIEPHERPDRVHLVNRDARVAEHRGVAHEPYIVMHLGHVNYCEGNWFPRVWARVVEWMEQNVAPVKLVGAAWDEPMIDAVYRAYKPYHLPIVRQPLHHVLTQIVNSVGMVGVDSGLSILATYYGKPALRLYPRWLAKMPGTWEDPTMLHPLNRWCFMDEMVDQIKPWGCDLKGFLGG